MVDYSPKSGAGTSDTKSKPSKYLTFTLAREEYGIDILKIKEIIGLMAITPVPCTPEFVKGVINLRGKVIPVIDLRLRFGLPPEEYTGRTCIVVVETGGSSGVMEIGIVVDSVSEVLNIAPGDIEPSPIITGDIETDYIAGMAKVDGRVRILLDIDRVLSPEEISCIRKTANGPV